MRRPRHTHEEHLNHEAWAIPYGDLVTLLLAFFVVMYAVSSVNEGKYRVMADAMSTAFGGPPRTLTPVQLGETQQSGSSFDQPSVVTTGAASDSASSPVQNLRVRRMFDVPVLATPLQSSGTQNDAGDAQLGALGMRVERALAPLVAEGLVTVRRSRTTLEIEIQSDLLFASGVAVPGAAARTTIEQLAGVLRDTPNSIRVEGYTDDVPIRTAQFQSNWELSAARAASVVHVLSGAGVAEPRLAVIGYGEHQPVADNATAQGRNSNRRVQLVILAAPQGADTATPPSGNVASAVAAYVAPSPIQSGDVAPTAPRQTPSSAARDDATLRASTQTLSGTVASGATAASTAAGIH
jgi:chemotaxis protein MotB